MLRGLSRTEADLVGSAAMSVVDQRSVSNVAIIGEAGKSM